MAPNIREDGVSRIYVDHDELGVETLPSRKELPDFKFNDIFWVNVITSILQHISGLYGIYLGLTVAKWWTVLFAFFLLFFTGLGVTAGCHRLWSHRTYKVNFPLKILLIIMATASGQDSIYTWAEDHRMHHKYSETNADPHNSRRGLFYSHFGWMLIRRHPDFYKRLPTLDLSDLYEDKLIMFQHKYYFPLATFFHLLLPTLIPYYLWGESIITSYFFCSWYRWMHVTHSTLAINSVAHRIGYRPYDKNIYPTDHIHVAIWTLGEGFHNYHHIFPWDYRTVDFKLFDFDHTTKFINFCAKIGWAYDLKCPSPELVKKRVLRTGDGSHRRLGSKFKNKHKSEETVSK